jgi:hypothetical protein
MLAILKARRPEKFDRASKLELSGGLDVTGARAKLLNKIARLQAEGQLPTGGGQEESEVLEAEAPARNRSSSQRPVTSVFLSEEESAEQLNKAIDGKLLRSHHLKTIDISKLENLTDEEADDLLHTWELWARPNQLEPDAVLAQRRALGHLAYFGRSRFRKDSMRSRDSY